MEFFSFRYRRGNVLLKFKHENCTQIQNKQLNVNE